MARNGIKQCSMGELVAMRERGETERRADAPNLELDDNFLDNAKFVMPAGKTPVHLRRDSDALVQGPRQRPSHSDERRFALLCDGAENGSK